MLQILNIFVSLLMLIFILSALLPHCLKKRDVYVPKYTKNNILYTVSFLLLIISNTLVITYDIEYGNTTFII